MTNTTSLAPVIARAERQVAAICRPIRRPTTKIAGYETPRGRHLAVDRAVKGLQVWTEDLPGRTNLRTIPEPYEASRPRNHHLTAQAPRVAKGAALLWKIEEDELRDLLAWYVRA